MGRWEPDAAGRFRTAAYELFEQVGYDQTTVAAIAERAGLTARTFFRHFADKPEVLFNGSEALQHTMAQAVTQAPASASALEALAAGLRQAGDFFDEERRPFARLRSAVIASHADLSERELIKLARISAALASALRDRGLAPTDASLAAEAGIAAFRVAYAQWVTPDEVRGYGEIIDATIARLKALLQA